jgi:lambda family phage tail tape measure protein
MSTQAAAGVDIVLKVDATPAVMGFTAAGRAADKLAASTREAGHATVSGMQAASASIRLLENPLGNNTRAIERLLSQSKLLSGAMQAAFPIVGAASMLMVVGKLGEEVADFIKKTQEMPRNLELGFRAMSQSAQMADDMLKVTNDKLDEQIAKLEHKPVNGMALALDEARVNADKLAESLAKDSKAMADLMKENANGFFAQVTGKDSTAGVSNAVNLYNRKMQDLGTQNSIALHDGDKGQSDALVQQMKDLTDAEKNRLKGEIALRTGKVSYTQGDTGEVSRLDYSQVHGDQTSNLNIERGALNQMNLRDEMATDQSANVQKTGSVAELESKKSLDEKAAELRKQQAADMMRGIESDAAVAKEWQAFAAHNAQIMNEDMNEKFKSNGLSSGDNDSINRSGAADLNRITAMRQGLDLTKQNSDALAEFSIQMALATGQMSKMGAAQAIAALHQQQFTDAMKALKDQSDYISTDKQYNGNETGRTAAQLVNRNQQTALTFNGGLQAAQDNQNINPKSSSAATGFDDAINEFVNASRDAAGQMRDLTTNTLQGLNQQIVAAISGQKTNFGNFGAGVARSVAGTALNKAEGSVMSLIPGLGKHDGSSASSALYVQMVGAGGASGGVAGAVGTAVNAATKGGGIGGFFSGILKSVLPGFAAGGSISGPSIVGEQGPELFIPGQSGTIIPNNKMVSSGGGDIHFHPGAIDARGSNDPAQVDAAVQRGIAKAAPHLTAASVQAVNEHNKRRGK